MCIRDSSSSKQVENDTTYEKGSEDKFVEVETYKENEEVLYKYTLLNSEGKNVYEETGLYREPNVEQLDNEVVRVGAVSYTHLDVYKRQTLYLMKFLIIMNFYIKYVLKILRYVLML